LTASSNRLYFLYHELRKVPSNYSYAIERDEFEKHADLFLQARSCGDSMFWPEITFDDGHISNYELALPSLASRGLLATFFVTVGWTEKRAGYMGWEQVRALHMAGQRIGAHGWTHTLLTHCDDNALRTELEGARLTLEDKLGTAITTMSLPGGRFDRRVLAACREAGYTQVYSSIPKAETTTFPSLVGRLNMRSSTGVESIARLLDPSSGVLAKLERRERWKMALQKTMGDRMYGKLWAALNRQETSADPGGTLIP
jgi:peptidoglycan/xylan/chitin deacetylase (PgdA/CDA1 family)